MGNEPFAAYLTPGPICKVLDNKDGTYSITYSADVSGKYHIHVLHGGEPIFESPWPITIVPLNTVGNCLEIIGEHYRSAKAAEKAKFRIYTLDPRRKYLTRGG